MFLLDINVISELGRPDKANPVVLAWASAIPAASFSLSAFSRSNSARYRSRGGTRRKGRSCAAGSTIRFCLVSKPAFSRSTPPWRGVARGFACRIAGFRRRPVEGFDRAAPFFASRKKHGSGWSLAAG